MSPQSSDYIIGEPLGAGPVGEVFRGLDPAGEPVAVKILRPDLSEDGDVASRFVVDRALVLAVDSPNVVRVRDLVVEDGCALAIVSDLVSGVDMRRALAMTGSPPSGFPAAEVARIGAGVAAGLTAVHAAGLAHGGLTPENVLLDAAASPPTVRVTDVATARLVAQASAAAYRAPELGARPDGTAAGDLYALGVLLYEFLRGTLPFPGAAAAAPARPEGTPDALWAVVTALLATDPAARPSSAGRVASVLATLADDLRAQHAPMPVQAPAPKAARPPVVDPLAGAAEPRRTRPAPVPLPVQPPVAAVAPAPAKLPESRKRVLAGALCAAVLLGGAAAWNLAHGDGTSSAPTAGQEPLTAGTPAGPATAAPAEGAPASDATPSVAAAPSVIDIVAGTADPAAVPSEAGGVAAAPAEAQGSAPGAQPGSSRVVDEARSTVRTVAYLSDRDGDWQLYRADSGGGDTRLTDERGGVMGPVYSPDANLIAYVADAGLDGPALYVMNADGSGRVRLAADAVRPVFSPDGSRIVFEGLWNGVNEVFVINADGSGLRRLTSDGVDTEARWPAFSADGTRIAYTSFRTVDGATTGSIWVVGSDGADRMRLTSRGLQPTFSPDGRTVAFTSSRDGDYEVYLMKSDGSGETRLTRSAGTDWSPVFSPDGTRILFLSNRGQEPDTGFDVYIMKTDGSPSKRLTTGSRTRSAATFSPDGTQIAYSRLSSERPQHYEVYVMNADGTGRAKLAEDGYGPVWATPRG